VITTNKARMTSEWSSVATADLCPSMPASREDWRALSLAFDPGVDEPTLILRLLEMETLLTPYRRGKKCDEMWSPAGLCQRCLAGPWECTGRSAGPSSTSPSSSRQQSEAANIPAASANGSMDMHINTPQNHANQPNHATLASHSISPITNMPPALAPTSAVPVLSPTGMLDSSRATNVTSGLTASPLAPGLGPGSVGNIRVSIPHNQHQPNLPQSHNSNPLPPPPIDSLPHFAGLWNGFLDPTDASRPFQGYQPLFDWPAGNQGNGMPSAVLTTCPDGSLAIDAPAPPQQLSMDPSVAEFWNDLSANFNPSPTGQQPVFNPGSRVLFLNSDRPMRQGVSLAEIYARVVESWLVGLPGQTREYARARILALHDKNSGFK
jgi:hypothetical protein